MWGPAPSRWLKSDIYCLVAEIIQMSKYCNDIHRSQEALNKALTCRLQVGTCSFSISRSHLNLRRSPFPWKHSRRGSVLIVSRCAPHLAVHRTLTKQFPAVCIPALQSVSAPWTEPLAGGLWEKDYSGDLGPRSLLALFALLIWNRLWAADLRRQPMRLGEQTFSYNVTVV